MPECRLLFPHNLLTARAMEAQPENSKADEELLLKIFHRLKDQVDRRKKDYEYILSISDNPIPDDRELEKVLQDLDDGDVIFSLPH